MAHVSSSEAPGTAVVAGVGPGLGASLCRALSSAGYKVVGLTRATDCAEAAKHLPADTALLPCELSRAAEVKRCFEQIEQSVGNCDLLIYNAGQLVVAPFLETSEEDMEACFRTNFYGGFLCAQRALPGMLGRRRGTLVFTGASASLVGTPGYSACAASKFALRGLAQTLAQECEKSGVSVLHIVVDGLIWSEKIRKKFGVSPSECFQPDELATAFVAAIQNGASWHCRELVLGPLPPTGAKAPAQ